MPKVLKLFQDVKSRWDSTSYMLVRAHQLKPDLEAFFDEHGAKFLRLDKEEWSQVEYLIDIVKPFCRYTQVIGATRRPTLHQAFEIYDKLFEHLERASNRLSRKRVPWKIQMKEALDAAHGKLAKYYTETQSSLGYFYGKATLLHPKTKDAIFQKSSWVAERGARPWAEIYWEALREDFDKCAANEYDVSSSQLTDMPKATFSTPDDLDAMLYEAPEQIEDEFDYYQKTSKYHPILIINLIITC